MQRSMMDASENSSMMFEKRKGTTDKGKDYEDLMVANLILKLITDDNVKDYRLSSNDKNFGAFDDVVLEVESTDGSAQKYAMQLKHAHDSKSILTKSSLTGKDGNFSVMKYFEDYKKISKVIAGFTLILFTNRKFNVADKEIIDGCGNKSIVPVDKKISISHATDTLNVTITKCAPESVLNTADKDGRCYRLELDENNNITDSAQIEEYKKFFDNFYLYTNQMDVDKMRESMSNRFQEMFFSNEHVYKEYLEFITNWSIFDGKKTKLNKVLTKKAIAIRLLSPFIETISFGEAAVNDKSQLFREAISKFQVTFLCEDDCDKIKQIWGNMKNELDDVKSVKVLKNKYQIYKDFNNLTDEERTKLLFLMNKCPLIVKEHRSTYKAISFCQDMKFVILGKDFSMENFQGCSTFRTLSDLEAEPEIYEKVLNTFECSLQGKKNVTLKTLVEQNEQIGSIITTSDLTEMLEDSLAIGEGKEILPPSHTSRLLSMNIIDYKFLKEINKNTLIVISCLKEVDQIESHVANFRVINIEDFLKSEEDTSREEQVYISKDDCSSEQFDAICRKIPTKITYHHFRVTTDGALEWVQSNGGIEDLEESRSQHQFIAESELFDYETNNINVVCADPGMGKSTLMKNLKNNYLPKFWTILICPKDHSKHFRENGSKVDEFIKYILRKTSEKYKQFDVNLVKILVQNGHVAYFWDGLDEISVANLMTVMEIIDELSKRGLKQWIASRSNLKKILETKFNVFSRTIKEFDEDEQKNYVRSRLNNHPDLEDIFKKINNNIKIFRYNDVLGIPLQIYMFTTLFRENPDKYKALLKNVFSVTDLYEHYVNEKFTIYTKEKENSDDQNDIVYERNKKFKTDRIDDYEKTAMKTHFEEEYLKEFNINCDQFLEEIRTAKDHVGLMTEVTEENIPNFIHNSFGEYFAASYLAKNRQKLSKFADVIFEERHNNIRFMLDLILAKNCVAHIAVLYKNLEVLENHKDQLNHKDQGGRNPLHLACSWGQKYPLLDSQRIDGPTEKYILKDANAKYVKKEDLEYRKIIEYLSKECNPNDVDELFHLNTFWYSDKTLCLLPLEILSGKNKINFGEFENFSDVGTVLYYSAMFDFSNIFCHIGEIPLVETKNYRHALMYLSASRGSSNCLQQLMYNKNYKNSIMDVIEEFKGYHVIHVACLHQHYDIVELLLVDSRNEIGAIDNDGNTPIHLACNNGNYKIVKLLIDLEADINAVNKIGEMPIHITCQYGHHEIAELLINSKVNINAVNKYGNLPIHTACQYGHIDIIKLLINSKVDMDAANHYGEFPIHIACQYGRHETVNSLINLKVNINAVNKHGDMPIHTACQYGRHGIVKLLINAKVNVNGANIYGVTPIHKACQYDHHQIVKFLIDCKANIDDPDKSGTMPIHTVCRNGKREMVKLLVDCNANINAVNKDGETPIHIAYKHRRYEIVKLLIDLKANINAGNKEGEMLIHIACQCGDQEIVIYLIDAKANINAVNRDGETSLHRACRYGHEEIVKLLIDHNVNVNAANQDGESPIFTACRYGHQAIITLLIHHKANINGANKDGETPIHMACKYRHNEIVKLLIDSGANIGAVNKDGETLIHIAAQRGDYKIVKLLIDRSANVNAANKDGAMLIHIACLRGDLEIVKLLMKCDTNINAANQDGEAPIHIACRNGEYEIMKLLIEHKANINVVNKDGERLIHIASQRGNCKIVKLLIECDETNINAANKDGETPIHTACQRGDYEVVKLLINRKANVNAADKDGETPIQTSCQRGYYEIVKLLIDAKANINGANKVGEVPIQIACKYKRYEIAKLLIDAHANINAVNKDGDSLVHIACQRGNHKIVKLLIDSKVNIDPANKDGETPLHTACRDGDYEIVELLIDSDANINAANKDGETPVHIACRHEHDQIVKLLMNRKANMNAANKDGEMLIHIACQHGDYAIVKLLIDDGANVNAANKDGETPIFTACQRGDDEIVELLIGAKVNIDAGNKDGQTPIYTACRYGHSAIVKLLINGNANCDIADRYGDTAMRLACRRNDFPMFALFLKESDQLVAKEKFEQMKNQMST